MNRPEEKTMDDDLWRELVARSVTPSMNLVLNNGVGDFLFLERINEPVKGHLWLPGGRLRNGETREEAIVRIALQELGIRTDVFDVLHVSDRVNQEIYPVSDMGDQHAALERYGPDVKTVHYWGGVSYVKLRDPAAKIELDSQSKRFEWRSHMPKNPHPYLRWYFQTMKEAGFPVPPEEAR